MTFKSRVLISLCVVVSAMGCGGGEPPPAEAPTAPTASATPAAASDKAPDKEAKPQAPKYDVDFVEAKPSPELDKPPRVTIDVPGYNQFLPASLVKSTKVRFKIQGFNEAPEGSYVQFVFDGKPFRKVTDPTEQIMLTDLAGTEEIPEGEHIVAAFVNRPNHESIKSERGVAVRRFYVGKRVDGGWDSNKDPLLVLGSPHGSYNGDVLVDWYVLNATMSGSEYSVRARIEGPGVKPEGIQRVITDWKPWIVLSAHDGAEYKVTVELLDPNGEVVPYGKTERTFTVKR